MSAACSLGTCPRRRVACRTRPRGRTTRPCPRRRPAGSRPAPAPQPVVRAGSGSECWARAASAWLATSSRRSIDGMLNGAAAGSVASPVEVTHVAESVTVRHGCPRSARTPPGPACPRPQIDRRSALGPQGDRPRRHRDPRLPDACRSSSRHAPSHGRSCRPGRRSHPPGSEADRP